MQPIKSTLLAFTLGALFAAPAFAGDKDPATPAVKTPVTGATNASDAVSARTTTRETGRIKAPTTSPTITGATDTNPGYGNWWADADRDGDGKLSAARASAKSAVVTRDLWIQLDGNSDGRLSASEVSTNSAISAAFPGMDGNGDGFVTQAEYTAYVKANRNR